MNDIHTLDGESDLTFIELTQIQHEVLVGGLLGDMHMSMEDRGRNPRIKIDRQYLDKAYLEWQFNVFRDFFNSPIKEIERYDERYNKTRKYVSFRTRVVPAFLKYYNKWYINKIKKVPLDLEFTPLILAVWFADDGCIVKDSNKNLTLKLSTDSFGEEGAGFLSKKLEDRFNAKFPIYRKEKDRDLFFIKASAYSAQAFIKEIEFYIIEMGMTRKSDIWQDADLNRKKIAVNDYHKIYEGSLLLKDFSLNQLMEIANDRTPSSARLILTDFCNKGYLSRYKSNEPNKPLHYVLTNSGKQYFESLLIK